MLYVFVVDHGVEVVGRGGGEQAIDVEFAIVPYY
jgi:hypothetical protein